MKNIVPVLLVFNLLLSVRAQNCLDLSGSWFATEAGTLTQTFHGQTDTMPVSGSSPSPVTITQNGCQYSFEFTATNPSDGSPLQVRRSGTINGTTVTISGPLV